MKFPLPLFLLLTSATLQAADPVALDTLVTGIVAQNPELAYYEAEIDAARAGHRAAGTRENPELSFELGRKRVISPSGALAGEGTAWSISLSQTFNWPGRLALRKALANQQIELAELGLTRFKVALTNRARALAYSLHAAQAQSLATAEVAARYQELREIFLQRDPAGLTPLLETRVIEAQELALQRRATQAALAAQAALIELNQLRGAPLDAALTLTSVRKAAPALAYALENGKNWNGHDPIAFREEPGANLVVILPKPRPAPEVYQQPESPKVTVSAMKTCEKCSGSGRIYFNTTQTSDVRAKESDMYGNHEIIGTKTSRVTDSMWCSRCLGTGEIKR